MNCRLVVGIVVHALDDIDFATRWPIWTIRPESRPRRTSCGHVHGVQYNETLREYQISSDTNAIPVRGHRRSRIDSHDGVTC